MQETPVFDIIHVLQPEPPLKAEHGMHISVLLVLYETEPLEQTICNNLPLYKIVYPIT